MVAFLKRRSARAGGLEQQRLQNLMTALRRFTEEADGLAQRAPLSSSVSSLPRCACAPGQSELGPGTARSKPSLSAAPGANAGRRVESVPAQTSAQGSPPGRDRASSRGCPHGPIAGAAAEPFAGARPIR